MSFLIKTSFWLALVLLILPVNREDAGIAQGPGVFESFAAVQSVVADMRGFCGRNPQACDTGAATLDVLRQKAVYSAGVVQGWLADGDGNGTLHVRLDETAPRPEAVVQTSTPAQNQTAQGQAALDQMATLINASNPRVPASDYPPL